MSNTNTAQAPSIPIYGYVRLKELLTYIPFSKATLYRHVSRGSFPTPTRLSDRITAWKWADVQAWLQEREDKP